MNTRKRLISKMLFFSFFEVDELLFIFEYFGEDCPEHIRIKLNQVVQGPINMDEEDVDATSNHPRNVLFELKMQATIRAAGLQEGKEGDASCVIDGTPLIIQCKRPQNYSSIKKNVSKARKQLRNDLKDLKHIKSKGVIAVSVGKIFHEGYKYLSVPSTELLEPMLSERIKKIVEKFQLEKEIARDNKILGLLCDLSAPVVIDSEKMIYAANQFAFFSASELPITKKFSNALNSYLHPSK